jgi:hypothetical protein
VRVGLQTTFVVSKKEPLATMLNRAHQAFLNAGLGEPTLRFKFSDPPLAGPVSSVGRVLKRFPEMARFLATGSPKAGFPGIRQLSNADSGHPIPFSSIEEIAAGVPRSFPFHSAIIHLYTPAFGELVPGCSYIGGAIPGVMLTDSWWINGRNRSLSAVAIVDAGMKSKKLPPLPEAVAAVIAVCGKARRTVQIPLTTAKSQSQASAASASPKTAGAVRTIVADYRGRLREILERASPPHDLPPSMEVFRESIGVTPGPIKPPLEQVFKPLGYTCRGESGTFTVRRRTEANLTVQLYLDVGTWSRQVTAIYQVLGFGFKASLAIPVAVRALGAAQYPIGDADRWKKIVENLAAIAAELDRSLVPEIERAGGSTPEWYKPEA